MSAEDTGKKNLIGCLFWFVAVLPGVAWAGFVISKLWLWFVVPFGLPVIGMWHGAGIDILLSFITHQTPGEEENKRVPSLGHMVGAVFLKPAWFLLLGWVCLRLGAM